MQDKIEKLGKSIIQHGPFNDRIYLMHLDKKDYATMPKKLIDLANENDYSKIFAKIPSSATLYFQRHHFFKEAYIPGFYNGKTGMYCVAKFMNPSREVVSKEVYDEIQHNLHIARKKTPSKESQTLSSVRRLEEKDADELAALYKLVFPSYPFPIDDADFLKKSIKDDVYYFGIHEEEKLVAAASAEVDTANANAEMTDFATHPDYRAKSTALTLLQAMELVMEEMKIKTCYTIARTLSPAMNITFAKNGYQFGGTLKNNTNIFDHIESMNVWYKKIGGIR